MQNLFFSPLSPSQYAVGVLSILGIYGLVQFFRRRKQDHEDVNWTPLEAVAITIFTYFATQIIGGLAAGLIGQSRGLSDDQINEAVSNSAGWQFLLVFAIEALTALTILWFIRRRKTPLRNIGVVKPRWRDAGFALAGFGIYFVGYGLIIANLVDRYLPQVDPNQRQELGFNHVTTPRDLVLVFITLAVLPPLVEEFMVRGFLYTGIRTKLPIVWAAVVTSAIFGIAHLEWGSGNPLLWSAAIDTFCLSMVLIALRQRTGSLWPGIGVHFIKNTIAFVALFIIKVV